MVKQTVVKKESVPTNRSKELQKKEEHSAVYSSNYVNENLITRVIKDNVIRLRNLKRTYTDISIDKTIQNLMFEIGTFQNLLNPNIKKELQIMINLGEINVNTPVLINYREEKDTNKKQFRFRFSITPLQPLSQQLNM